MARVRYREVTLDDERAAMVVAACRLVDSYRGQRVTVRQLYYRFVGGDLFPRSWVDDAYNAKHNLPPGTVNTVKNYKRFASLVADARYGGLLDWDAVEDRTREPTRPRDWASAKDAVDEVADRFRLDRWAGQPYHVEVWCEKAALAGVLAPVSHDYHVTLMVNRGYSSASAMKESADRLRWAGEHGGRRPVVLYVGDHDPSGIDMVRDVRDRLVELGAPGSLDVRRVALTIEQVREYNLPPNPAKLTDARAAAYVEKYGYDSWEVDALPPDVLARLVRRTVTAYVDRKKMEEVVAREALLRGRLRKLAAGFAEGG